MARKTQAPPENQPDDVEDLRRQLSELRTRNSELESNFRTESEKRMAAERAQMSEEERRIAAEQDACNSLLDSLKGQADSIEGQIAQLADEPGHGSDIAKLNRQLARIESQLLSEEGRKDYLQSERDRAKSKAANPPPAPTVGRKLANGVPTDNFSPATKAWLDAHPKAYTDASYCKRAIGYAGLAANVEDITPDTPEFFAFIEEKLGERHAAPQNDENGDEEIPNADSPYSRPEPEPGDDTGEEIGDAAPSKPQARAAGPGSMSSVLASPSRSIPGAKPGKGGRVPALTPDQKAAADALYGSIRNPADRYAKYAANMKFMSETYSPEYFGQAN